MSNAVDNAMGALAGLGTVGADAPSPLETQVIDRPSGSSGYLQEILARRHGAHPETEDKGTGEDKYLKEIESLKGQLEKLQSQHKQDFDGWRQSTERQFKTLETLAQRPAQILQPAPQPQPLPTLELDDPDLAAAFNTFEQRIDQKLGAGIQHLLNQSNQTQMRNANREFNAALKKVRSLPDWDKHFNEEAVRNDAAKLLGDPRFADIDWDRELELAYDAKTARPQRAELEELRKYKAENEKKLEREQSRQKANLGLVPSMGGKGSSQPRGLVADSILNDARKAGKRLSWGQFGKEFQKRRGIG